MGKIYFTSDLHFNHNRDFIWKARGFNSVEEMNETIIKNFNKIITDEDTLYLCGDSMLGMDAQAGLNLLRRLKGQKYLVIGNHDTDNRIASYKESGIFVEVQPQYRVKYKGRTYLITHYPTLVSNNGFNDVINIHGHTHSKNHLSENPYCYNVNVDAWDCVPVDFENIHNEGLKIWNKEKKDGWVNE